MRSSDPTAPASDFAHDAENARPASLSLPALRTDHVA